MHSDPRSLYTQRLSERQAEISRRERRHRALGNWRLAAVACTLATVGLALAHTVPVLWAALPGAAFVALVVAHERLLRKMERRKRAARFYKRGIERLDGAWAGGGEGGARYLDPAHPYARDLVGKGSLFELLCAARTHIGEDTLARWLLSPAAPDAVRARQEAVEELRPLLDLREELAILAEEARTGVDPVSLAAWGEAPPLLAARGRAGVWALTVAGVAGAAALRVGM